MPVRGLTLVVVGRDPARLEAGLRLAATSAALGGRTRLFLEGEAVALAGNWSAEAGALLQSCHTLGVSVTLCQSGLAAAGLDLRALDPRLETGGLTGLLATLGDDNLSVL